MTPSGAIVQHQGCGEYPLDILRVGDPGAAGRSNRDWQLLEWSAQQERRIVSHDRITLPAPLAERLAAGRRSAGVILLPPGLTVSQIVDLLVLVACASSAEDWENRCTWQP
jgi:hypothetical protein